MTDIEEVRLGKPLVRKSVRDAVFGFCVAALAAAFVLWGIPDSVITPASVKALPLSPAFLPYVLTASIGFLGLVCGIQATVGRGVPAEDGEGFYPAEDWPIRLLVLAIVLTAFYYLPDLIGMLSVSIIAMALLVWMGGETSIVRGLLVSILIPLFVYFFFIKVAQVPLPQGLLEGWI